MIYFCDTENLQNNSHSQSQYLLHDIMIKYSWISTVANTPTHPDSGCLKVLEHQRITKFVCEYYLVCTL